VIDCLCFVPEWTPVLMALESQKQARLQSDDGRYLNLCRGRSVVSVTPIINILDSNSVTSSDCTKLVDSIVHESILEPIRECQQDALLAK
jgi:hypothetical protein